MPRTTTAKREASLPTLSSLKKAAKNCLQGPAKFAVELNKTIKRVKKQETQLRIALNKNQAAIKLAQKNFKNAAKSSTKKQLVAKKKALQIAVKAQTALTKQQQLSLKLLEALKMNQVKMVAIGKHLRQFDKEWPKQTATAKKQKIAKNKKPVRSRRSADKAARSTAQQNPEQYADDSEQNNLNNEAVLSIDEEAELSS